jgi:hypothetical protein
VRNKAPAHNGFPKSDRWRGIAAFTSRSSRRLSRLSNLFGHDPAYKPANGGGVELG